jgi:hypothetical protein
LKENTARSFFHSWPLTDVGRIGVTLACCWAHTDVLHQSRVFSGGGGACGDVVRPASTGEIMVDLYSAKEVFDSM